MLWGRIRRRFARARAEKAAAAAAASEGRGGSAPPPLTALDPEMVEEITEEIELAISARRRRVNARLGQSLKRFKGDITEEVSVQASAVRERQERLARRCSLLTPPPPFLHAYLYSPCHSPPLSPLLHANLYPPCH